MADYIPMTLRQYEEQNALLNDPEYIGGLSMDELVSIQEDRQRYNQHREERRARLQGQGLSDKQIAEIEEVERQSPIDPRAEELQTGDTLDAANLEGALNQGPRRDVAGMVEGGKQAIEGVFDLAMDISHATGLDDDQSRLAWKHGVSQRRMEARQDHVNRFGRLPGEGYELLGSIIPWLAATPGKAANLTTYLLRNTGLGAIGAAAQFQPEEKELGDRWMDVAFGTALGAGIGTVFGVPGALRRRGANWFVRSFNELDSQQRQIVEEQVRLMTGDPNFTFSAAQLTGARFFQNLELGAAQKAT